MCLWLKTLLFCLCKDNRCHQPTFPRDFYGFKSRYRTDLQTKEIKKATDPCWVLTVQLFVCDGLAHGIPSFTISDELYLEKLSSSTFTRVYMISRA